MYAWIDRHKRGWPVSVQCAVLGVSPSGYHQHFARRATPEQRKRLSNDALLVHIKAIQSYVVLIATCARYRSRARTDAIRSARRVHHTRLQRQKCRWVVADLDGNHEAVIRDLHRVHEIDLIFRTARHAHGAALELARRHHHRAAPQALEKRELLGHAAG